MAEIADIAAAGEQVIRVLDLTGVAAMALLAGALAREHRFDPVGYIFLGVVAGLGGGMLRDTLLQVGQPVAFTDGAYLITAVLASLFAYAVKLEGPFWNSTFRVIDAIALGTWGAVGAHRALDAGMKPLPAILLGTITAVGGGMIRDLMVRRTPIVFGGNTLYATCATAAAVTMVILHPLISIEWVALSTLAGTVVGSTFCLVSYHQGWRLPASQDWTPRIPRRPVAPNRPKS